MTTTPYHLPQLNIARMVAPIDSDVMAGFVARIDEINALADNADGFIWRLKTDDNNATSIRVFDDEMLIVNMSVWRDVDALHQYTYYSAHAEVYRQRRDWFHKLAQYGIYGVMVDSGRAYPHHRRGQTKIRASRPARPNTASLHLQATLHPRRIRSLYIHTGWRLTHYARSAVNRWSIHAAMAGISVWPFATLRMKSLISAAVASSCCPFARKNNSTARAAVRLLPSANK